MKPLLSIVVPAYGSGAYLPRSLGSIARALSKVGPGLVEVLPEVDPKEGDDSDLVIDSFRGDIELFSPCFHKVRAGLLSSRLLGAERSRGSYVAFLDADDYVDESAFLSLLPILAKEGPDVLSYSFYLSKGGKSLGRYPFSSSFKGSGEKLFASFFLDIGTRGFMWTKAYRRELLLGYDGPFLSAFEDVCFNAIVLPKAKTSISIRKPIVYYEEGNPDSLTSQRDPSRYLSHVTAFAAARAYYDLHSMEREKLVLRSHAWRMRLSFLYAKKKAKEDGMGRAEKEKADRLFEATIDLSKPLFQSVPEFEETYFSFLKKPERSPS